MQPSHVDVIPPANPRTGELLPTPPDYFKGLRIITDTDELVRASIERIMSAETAEEILANPDSLGLRDLTGQRIRITAVRGIMPSTLRDGDYYLLFDAQLTGDGSTRTLTTGSPYAGSQIAALHHKGKLPRRVRPVQLESTSNPGQSSLWIVDDEPTVRGTDGEPDF